MYNGQESFAEFKERLQNMSTEIEAQINALKPAVSFGLRMHQANQHRRFLEIASGADVQINPFQTPAQAMPEVASVATQQAILQGKRKAILRTRVEANQGNYLQKGQELEVQFAQIERDVTMKLNTPVRQGRH